MDEACLAQASWREEIVPVHWLVEVGLNCLVSRVVSRGMSRSGCRLRKSLGSLSAGGWGSVPAQLVVWPEAS